ncbi:POU domain, class 6, transcription factor 2-like [Durio zibethinus]|uniref:POU domain, class 6, transcription factor 2-like n=1 Tax=Durio zibethinus TaxID=66656 RepID=A0A6P6ATE8_DURZI|nr:POU domain, class 6, transcription factor 2-like [Durio zibethinus]
MAVDDSFKKPGAVPFKWEIRPGVPKVQQQQKQHEQSLPQKQKPQKPKQPPPPLPPPASPFINQRSLPTPAGASPRQKLKPPPAGSYLLLTPEPRSHSFRSTPRARSERWRFDQPTRLGPECVPPGCFPSPLLRQKGSKRRTQKPEPDYVLDLETLSRWSVSSRKSLSQFYSSPASSFSSYRSSPRPVADADWAGFGLF